MQVVVVLRGVERANLLTSKPGEGGEVRCKK